MNRVSLYLEQLKDTEANPIDVIWCTIRYGASPNNYKEFNFRELTSKERDTYVTHGLSQKIIKRYNDPSYIDIFEDKTKFAKHFSAFFGRKWISTEGLTKDRLNDFIDSVGERLIVKPACEAQGEGIIVYSHVDVEEAWSKIQNMPKAILEEWIQQHEVLNTVYSDAVNCLRIITLYKDGKTHFLAGGMTWGNGMKIANASASGIVSPVNFNTGKLDKPAADFYGNCYRNHPITKENLIGIKIPYWKETVRMLREAATVVPEVGYIGWDIAITPAGPIIIEGNTTPGYKYYQIPIHMDNKIGNKKRYKKWI